MTYDMTKINPGIIQILIIFFIEIHNSKWLMGHITLHIDVWATKLKSSDSAILIYYEP